MAFSGKGFSSISEGLSPTELVELLNEYLTAMTDIVIEHGGIIDKYQGDSIMAEFGVPIPQEDHALRACRAALGMTRGLDRLRRGWAKEGRPELFARVGVKTGRMLVGNLGSRRIMDYTVMGDQVNLASRLEGANKLYGTRIMISEFTRSAVRDRIVTRELDRIRVKGREEPVRVYELLGTAGEAGAPAGDGGAPDAVAPEALELSRRFEEALARYRDRDFDEARDAFLRLAGDYPDDGPARLYVERCRRYVEAPPPAEWDGVYTMKTK